MASGNNTTSALPPVLNPEDPYAYLPPVVAHELSVFTYVVCSCTAVMIWEIVCDLPTFWKLFVTRRPALTSVAYFISRIGVFVYSLFSLLFLAVGASNCIPNWVVLAVGWSAGSAFTSLLFLFRVLALYHDNKVVSTVFIFLWLCVLGGSFTVGIGDGDKVVHLISGSAFCTSTVPYPAYAGAAIIIPAIFDTLVFFAISYRLYPSYEVEPHSSWAERIRLSFRSNGLPRLSRALMQGGQQYYMLSVIGNIIVLVFYFAPSTPTPYRAMAPLILLVCINAMACKIYRDVRFGLINEETLLASSRRGGRSKSMMTSMAFGSRTGPTVPTNTTAGDSWQQPVRVDVNVSKMVHNGTTTTATDIELDEAGYKQQSFGSFGPGDV